MSWTKYPFMEKALDDDIQKGDDFDTGHSTPDIYGKALQFLISLSKFLRDGKSGPEEASVWLWRGMLSIIALQRYLNLPLQWERVRVPNGGTLLNKALSHTPENPDLFLFPDNPDLQWDGSTFYALKWAPPNQAPTDLLLFSPLTLVYPVADWRDVYDRFPELRRFFRTEDGAHGFELRGVEKSIVCYWLSNLYDFCHACLTPGHENTAQKTLLQHINEYQNDMGGYLDGETVKNLKPCALPGGTGDLGSFLKPLMQSVLLTDEGSPFADQLCLILARSNPFENCEYAERYRIRGYNDDDGNQWYAFLPIRPSLRGVCRERGLAEHMEMRLLPRERNGEQYIQVTTQSNEMPGQTLEWRYKLSDREDYQPNAAVGYRLVSDNSGKLANQPVNVEYWPMISVWPGVIAPAWKEYYVLVDDDCAPGSLKVYDGDNETESGDSHYVVRTRYAPGVIPIVRACALDGNGASAQARSVSVGIVTPRMTRAEHQNTFIDARVAIDFGTSSTRVFAKIDGVPDIQEIRIMEDEPLAATYDYDDSGKERKEAGGKARIKCDNFIAPNDIQENSLTLFSVYHYSHNPALATVKPMLDGVIYQPLHPRYLPETPSRNLNLISDLKWDVHAKRPYYLAFMKQLCLHVMSRLYRQGVQKIRWRYALPISMSPAERALVQNIWQDTHGRAGQGEDLLTYLQSVSGANFQHVVDSNYLSESEAASRYFLYDPEENAINTQKGYLVVDIGGGSTDVALWQEKQGRNIPAWHESIKIAGQRMFSYWINLSEMSETSSDSDLKRLVNYAEHSAPEIKNAMIDRVLNTHEQTLMESYNRSKDKDWAIQLRKRVNLWTSLLFFSLGCQIGALMKARVFEIPNMQGYFIIAVGGHGSKILDWLGTDVRLGSDVRILKSIFCEGIAVGNRMNGVTAPSVSGGAPVGATLESNSVDIRRSKRPKCEVARGLLRDTGSGTSDDSNVPEPPEALNVPIELDDYVSAAQTFRDVFNKSHPDDMRINDIDVNSVGDCAALVNATYSRLFNAFMVTMFRYLIHSEYPKYNGVLNQLDI